MNRPDGYQEAFYDLAKMMGIPAQPRSPKEVWEREMKPRLALLLTRGGGMNRACCDGDGWYTSYSGGFAHPMPCASCNPKGLPRREKVT